ncbi:zinc finger BED domain-containing 1-like protein [Labeo rohita]|uniref:Zinc finger BED domain-containing 1-like protein n=1 Tax=Labeo rohita TaxID=84645 RepID=A0A498NWI1_LABRO|nr:zinc finger BED domain-containing 1-like protein [Labeo rohita]RXN35939.1 zinc finger BED domain-containing 1-like protein [Labeo rohita]
MDPFLSRTLHYIDGDWKLRQRCLEMPYFPADHTADMIVQGLKDMLSEWDLAEEKLSAITTDNGANVVKAAALNGWIRQQCFGHRLHLAIDSTRDGRDGITSRIVHAPDHKTHNQRLHAVMKRLRECGLMLNPAKCQFCMDRLNFMGILLTQKEIGPTEERVRAVVEAREPQSA